MSAIFWLFMMLMACMNVGGVFSMEKKKETGTTQKSKNYLLNNPEVIRAKALFGDYGLIAAGELIIKDKSKIIAQIKGLHAFKDFINITDDYDSIDKKIKESVNVDINLLRFIFSDQIYDEYVNNIKNICKSIVLASKNQQAKNFFAQTKQKLHESTMRRQASKQLLLEKQVSCLLLNACNELVQYFNDVDFELNEQQLEDMVDQHCFCAEHMKVDSVRKNTQVSFIDFCYRLSEYAWIQGKDLVALKYGNRASKKHMDWNVEGSVPSRTLMNWLELVNKKKHKESFFRRTQPIFRKRRLPKPKKFEKRQKMSIPEQAGPQTKNV